MGPKLTLHVWYFCSACWRPTALAVVSTAILLSKSNNCSTSLSFLCCKDFHRVAQLREKQTLLNMLLHQNFSSILGHPMTNPYCVFILNFLSTHHCSSSMYASSCCLTSAFLSCIASRFSLCSLITPASIKSARRGFRDLCSSKPAVKCVSWARTSSNSSTQFVWFSSSTPVLALCSTAVAQSSHVCIDCKDKRYLWTRERAWSAAS